jgi:hypothetical protein
MPRTSTDAPPAGEVARRNAKVDNLEIAASRARHSVACAAVASDMPSGNLRVDAALAQSQLAATLPRTTDSFLRRSGNVALPQSAGTPAAVNIVPVNGSKQAVPAKPLGYPQTIQAAGRVFRAMQQGRSCGASGPRDILMVPCGVSPEWGSAAAGVVTRPGTGGGSEVLAWIRAHPWPSVGLAGAIVLGLGYAGGRR